VMVGEYLGRCAFDEGTIERKHALGVVEVDPPYKVGLAQQLLTTRKVGDGVENSVAAGKIEGLFEGRVGKDDADIEILAAQLPIVEKPLATGER